MKIFHVLTRDQWQVVRDEDVYEPNTLKKDGFVHCCKTDQICLVANFLFKNEDRIVLLEIDVDLLKSKWKLEPSREVPQHNMLFPHILGPVNSNAIIKDFILERDASGSFILPDKLF